MGRLKLLQGSEAVVEGGIAAGCRFFAGYPITPANEITEGFARRLPQVGGVFIQMEDEIASLGAVIGASLAGAKAMTATSGPGFSLMQEHIGYAFAVEAPCVIVEVMRGGPSTGNPTFPSQGDVMQARWGAHGDTFPITIAASTVRECFDLTVKAFNFAERLRTPVILLLDEIIAHLREGVEIPSAEEIEVENRRKPKVPPSEYIPYMPGEDGVPLLADFGEGYRYHITGLVHDIYGFPTSKREEIRAFHRRLREKILRNRSYLELWEEFLLEDAEEIVIAYGSVARAAKRAIREARSSGKKAGLFRLITIWPFPEEKVRELARKAKFIVVPEMNLGQIVLEVERAVKGRAPVIPLNKVDGTIITPEEISELLK